MIININIIKVAIRFSNKTIIFIQKKERKKSSKTHVGRERSMTIVSTYFFINKIQAV